MLRPKGAAGRTAQDDEDPCETLEVSELCSVYRRTGLACTACLRQVLKNGAAGKCYCTGAKREAQSRQKRKSSVDVPLP